MEDKMVNPILLEFKKLNERLDHMDDEFQNKFGLIDARFNTLEEIVLSMQNDIGSSIANLENKISILEKNFNNLEDKMSKLETKMFELENIVQGIQNTITNLENIVEDILNRMLQFETRLNSLEKITLRMEYTFNDKISALFDAHSYYTDQYQKIQLRIRQNEMKIANLSMSNC